MGDVLAESKEAFEAAVERMKRDPASPVTKSVREVREEAREMAAEIRRQTRVTNAQMDWRITI